MNIKENPYKTICEYYESLFYSMGGIVFSLLSLLPVSLILPKIKRNNREIRIHLNMLLLSPAGSAKSSICENFRKISYNPLSTIDMSPPRLIFEFKKRKGDETTLIIEDIAIWFMDEERIKHLEGATGEESSLNRDNMRNIKDTEADKKTNTVALLCGTPEIVSNNRIRTGILRRVSPLIVYHSEEENERIVDKIIDNMGENGGSYSNEEEKIKEFYQELKSIQDGTHNEINPIEGYIFPEKIKSEVRDLIKRLSKPLWKRYGITTATETEEIFRFLVCHAFLNIFNKKEKGLIKDNKLIIDEKDMKVARKLIIREMSTKSIILQCIESIDYYNIKTREQLRAWEERRRKSGKKPIPKEAKVILNSMIKK